MNKEISKEDRAYFAGLLDGEGCIRLSKDIVKTTGSIGYNFRVTFEITYKKVLLEMQEFFGGNIYERDMKKRRYCDSVQKLVLAGGYSPETWKQLYDYSLSGRDALYFLKVVEPFCREKKEQAALGIRYEQGRRPHAGGRGRSASETERCEFFYKELQRLKHEQPDKVDSEIDFIDDQQKLFSLSDEETLINNEDLVNSVYEEPSIIETEVITKTIITETKKKTEVKKTQSNLNLFVEN